MQVTIYLQIPPERLLAQSFVEPGVRFIGT